MSSTGSAPPGDEPLDPASGERELMEEDAARLYQQGWAVHQVAERFGCSDDVMRRILRRRAVLRRRREGTD